MTAIVTVGYYLTESERRLLTSLASDLECKAEFAPDAKDYAATRDALRKLMYLPADKAAGSGDEVDRLRAEVSALTTRRDELLALVVKVTRETPYPAELDECKAARAKLIAEVGTLRSRCDELRAQLPNFSHLETKAQRDALIAMDIERRARLRALLVEPAVSMERTTEIRKRAGWGKPGDVFDLAEAVDQLHALLAALREFTGVTP